MGFDTSNLTEFTAKAREILLEGVLFNEDYARYSIMTGVYHKEYLNMLETNPTLQAGTCNVSEQADKAAFDEKEITVTPISVVDGFCISDLNRYDLQPAERGTGKGRIANDIRTALVTDEVARIKKKIDKLMWQGDVAGGDLFDGWATKAAADADVITVPSVAVTVSNIDDVIQDMILAVPGDMWSRGKMTIHMGLDYYNLYHQNRVQSNMYHDNPNQAPLMEDNVFGYSGRATVKYEPGLDGTKYILLTWDKNLYVGTDELREVAQAKLYFNELDKKVYFLSDFKIGVEYAFGKEIVLFIGA